MPKFKPGELALQLKASYCPAGYEKYDNTLVKIIKYHGVLPVGPSAFIDWYTVESELDGVDMHVSECILRKLPELHLPKVTIKKVSQPSPA